MAAIFHLRNHPMEVVTVEVVTVEVVTVEATTVEAVTVEAITVEAVVVMVEAFDVMTKPLLLHHGGLHPA